MSEAPPPYTITSEILTRVAQIAEAVGRAEAAGVSQDLRLRRINRIRTIQGSLAIEGNILSEEQIATILDGKPVVAPLRDIQEAWNAIEAYDRYEQWNPASEADLLTAHGILMTGLVDAPGHYRRRRSGRELGPRQPERVLQCHSREFRPRREHAVHCLYAGDDSCSRPHPPRSPPAKGRRKNRFRFSLHGFDGVVPFGQAAVTGDA